LPKPTALHDVTLAILLKLPPELVERVRPLPFSGTHTSPSRSGAVRISVEPPAGSVAAALKLAPPSVLTSSLPLPLS